MIHDTKATIGKIRKYIFKSIIWQRSPGGLVGDGFLETSQADHHDSLRDDGMPVASVVVEGIVEIYPYTTTEKVGIAKREQIAQRWAVDTFVDDSDPSVGIWGDAPVPHSDHATLDEAIIELGKVVLEHCIRDRMEEHYTKEQDEEAKFDPNLDTAKLDVAKERGR